MPNFLRDPDKIVVQTFDRIRELSNLDRFNKDEKQVVLHLIRMCGQPALADSLFFSPDAITVAKKAIKNYAYMLYDHETVKCGFAENLLYQEPLCFINKAAVISQAKAAKQTRAMTAIDHWKNYSKGSIAIFGKSGTALAHYIELLRDKELELPALIIATNSGFINAEHSKQALIDQHAELGIEYIVLQGTVGGSMLAAEAVNALLRIQQDIYV